MSVIINCSTCSCSLLDKKSYTIDADTAVCKRCFFTYYCTFCKEPVLKKDCPGHTTESAGNRFLKDDTFVWGARFEAE